MAKSNARAKYINMAYGLGASVVIIGALFKILHFQIGPLTGGVMLTIGLVTEALIFVVSAFEPIEDEYNWELVYPELVGNSVQRNQPIQQQEDTEGMLSKKLDEMLKEAKIDSTLMSSLGDSIKNFEGAAKNMGPTVDAMNSQKKYSEELTLAAAQMESLNNLYKIQVESNSKQAEANQAVAENADKLRKEMESLTTNLSSLNSVYGGMLTAMRPNA